MICIWDTKNGKFLLGPFHGHKEKIFSLYFSDNDLFLNSRSIDCFKKWRISNFRFNKSFEVEDIFDVSQDGNYILGGSEDLNGLKIYDSETLKCVVQSKQFFNKQISFAKFSYSGKYIINGIKENYVTLLRTEDLSTIKTIKEHNGEVTCACFSHNEMMIATGGTDNTVVL
jgi:WD40 repeat protein